MEAILETHPRDETECTSKLSDPRPRLLEERIGSVALNQSDLLDSELPTSSPIIDFLHDLLPASWWISSNFGKIILKLLFGRQLEGFTKVNST